MSAGFTRGPWEYTATVSFHDRPDLPCVVDQHRLIVAQCWDDGHDEEECEANARLIASSPTMAAYIQRKADEGDLEAAQIMEAIHAR